MGTIMMAVILDMSPSPWQAINDGVMGVSRMGSDRHICLIFVENRS